MGKGITLQQRYNSM